MPGSQYEPGTEAVNLEQAARMLGISLTTMREKVAIGLIPSFRIGKLVRVRRTVLDQIMNGGYDNDGKIREAPRASRRA